MSHIAFELDALPLVPKVARSAGIGEAVVGWGLTQMWEWCWREKTDKVTTNHLRGFFGSECGAVLVDFGFLEAIGSSLWRVRGADRYLRIQAGREKGGKAAAAAGNLKRGNKRQLETPPQLAPSTLPADSQHTSQLTPRLSATSDERLATSDERILTPAKKPREPKPPPDPRHQPLVDAFDAAYRQRRGIGFPWDGRAVKVLQRLLKRRPSHLDALWPVELAAAFGRALDAKFPEFRSLDEFERDLPRYLGTGPPANRRDEPVVRPEGRVFL